MSKPKTDAETQAVLMALDQLSQTMDVMRQVVGRLKRRVEAAESSGPLHTNDSPAPAPDRDEARAKHPDTRVLH